MQTRIYATNSEGQQLQILLDGTHHRMPDLHWVYYEALSALYSIRPLCNRWISQSVSVQHSVTNYHHERDVMPKPQSCLLRVTDLV